MHVHVHVCWESSRSVLRWPGNCGQGAVPLCAFHHFVGPASVVAPAWSVCEHYASGTGSARGPGQREGQGVQRLRGQAEGAGRGGGSVKGWGLTRMMRTLYIRVSLSSLSSEL